ncbi:hypothetical protein PhCBS80983_g06276 [Powellomyces hirtus]|uniref:Uncharacterized protein n=1 Tax=Powellomyces hirtus TaxID=109895 RepID=A0A507DQM5_9FUNG|nr:hypothetical protein PhCBS80983_g06276 [Powellomyces hirtus]
MESILNELVDVLRSNNSPEQTRHDNDTVEREVFWSEKIKHAEARTPTGYFAQPVFQKFRGFGRVEMQFVNNPYYLEVPNAPTGYLRDADERSLNPDTFTRVYSDSDLRRMRKGQTRHREPQSEQETRHPIRKGSSGYSRESDLHQRLAELREGQSRRMNEHLGHVVHDVTEPLQALRRDYGMFNPNDSLLGHTGLGTSGVNFYANTERIIAKREGKRNADEILTNVLSEVDKHIASSERIKSEKRIPSPLSSDEEEQYATPMNLSPTPRTMSPKSKFKSILKRNKSGHFMHPTDPNRGMPTTSTTFAQMLRAYRDNGGRPLENWNNINI